MSEKWIDVSAHQGNIDWKAVAGSDVVGAIIRAGYGNSASQVDKQFLANIKGALTVGIKVAVYWFSYADTPEDARKEYSVCKQTIEPYKAQILFVASDYEYDSVKYYKRIHGQEPPKDLINQMVNAFLNEAKADDMAPMLYTNNDYRKNIFTPDTIAAWPIWLADYTGQPDISCDIQQTGSTGTVPGIAGNVDMNICFKNFTVSTPSNPTTPAPTPKPAGIPASTYTVKSGDTMSAISPKAGVSVQALITANPQIKDPNLIHPGDVLKIPAGSTTPQVTEKKQAVVGGTVIVKHGAVYGGLSSARGALVPSYVTGARRYTINQIATHNGAQEALLKELNSWVAIAYLTMV